MKRINILTSILVLFLVLPYTHAAACNITFSFAKARAGHDLDFDRFLAEAADGPWKALARTSSLSLGGLSSYSLDPALDLERGRASSFSMFLLPLRVTQEGTQRIEFFYSGLLDISSNNTLLDDIGAYVGYRVAAFDNKHNRYCDKDYLDEIDSVNVDKEFAFEYDLEVGDDIQLLFLLSTFAKLYGKDAGIEELDLLADFSNSFDIVKLEGLVVVPIPSAILLLGPALLGLLTLRRRKR